MGPQLGRPVAVVTSWSYSRYAAYEQCPLQFKLRYIDKLPEPESPSFRRGNEVHKALADYIVGKRDALPDAVTDRYHKALYAEMRAIAPEDKQVEQQWAFTASWEPTGWFAKDAWLRSVLDFATLYDDMSAEVVDHKTGKRYGSNDDQMELFAVALMAKFLPAQKVTTRLVYVDTGDQEFGEYTRDEFTKIKSKWEGKVRPMLSDTTFLPRPNEKCRFCNFSKSKGGPCRYG